MTQRPQWSQEAEAGASLGPRCCLPTTIPPSLPLLLTYDKTLHSWTRHHKGLTHITAEEMDKTRGNGHGRTKVML